MNVCSQIIFAPGRINYSLLALSSLKKELASIIHQWFYGLAVRTLDSESSNPSSILGRTSFSHIFPQSPDRQFIHVLQSYLHTSNFIYLITNIFLFSLAILQEGNFLCKTFTYIYLLSVLKS